MDWSLDGGKLTLVSCLTAFVGVFILYAVCRCAPSGENGKVKVKNRGEFTRPDTHEWVLESDSNSP